MTRHRVALATALTTALASALALGACTTSSPAGSSATKVVNVTIHGKEVSPAPGNVDVPVGETLRLVVTSDHDDELHAHGFDVEVTLTAGRPKTLDLRATTPGVYEIETHHPPLTLMHVVVR